MNADMLEKIRNERGFIAALDQSGGSTPKALKLYGIGEDEYDGEEEMFDLIHAMRSRICTSPSFHGDRVLGAILFEMTMDREIEGMGSAEYLWKVKNVVPFLKVDKGLADEENGAQVMKPIPDLDALCERAVAKGVFGTKMRSVIHEADQKGIADNIRQQMDFGLEILDQGLVPILEPEVSLKSDSRVQAEALVLSNALDQMERVPEGKQVMWKLTIPSEPNLYKPLIDHPQVLRVVALSGGYSREDACRELAKNDGMIASFSRALLEVLQAKMDDQQFDQALGNAIEEIACASTGA